MNQPKNLNNYRLTARGQALMPKVEGKPGRNIMIAASKEGDPYFECLAKNLADYHAAELLARKDGKGALYVQLAPAKKEQKIIDPAKK